MHASALWTGGITGRCDPQFPAEAAVIAKKQPSASSTDVPVLAVDLDGTLIETDFALVAAASYIRANPLRTFRVLRWLAAGGKLHAKLEIAKMVMPDCASLPWRADVCEFVRAEQNCGRKVVLATAAAAVHAAAAAKHFGGFAAVHSSQPGLNLHGKNKADLLDETYGAGNWDYVGDSPRQDPPVMRRARVSHLARKSSLLSDSAKKIGNEFGNAPGKVWAVIKILLSPRQRGSGRQL